MPEVNFLYLAALTRDVDDAGSSDQLNVTINVNGIDVAVAEFVADHPQAQGYLQHAVAVVSFDLELLTNSSVRIGNRGDDAWAPQEILLFAVTDGGGIIPIAMETDLTHWLSSDPSEGRLTLPLRLVERGDSSTLIHRLLLLVRTADEDDAGTDSPVRLQVIGSDGSCVCRSSSPTRKPTRRRTISNKASPIGTTFRRGRRSRSGKSVPRGRSAGLSSRFWAATRGCLKASSYSVRTLL